MTLLWRYSSRGPFQPKCLWDEGIVLLEQEEEEPKLHEAGLTQSTAEALGSPGSLEMLTGGTSPGQRRTVSFGAVDTQERVKKITPCQRASGLSDHSWKSQLKELAQG